MNDELWLDGYAQTLLGKTLVEVALKLSFTGAKRGVIRTIDIGQMKENSLPTQKLLEP